MILLVMLLCAKCCVGRATRLVPRQPPAAARLSANAHWVVHQWRLYERSICSLLELQARSKSSYTSMCCSSRYILAPEYGQQLLGLPLAAAPQPRATPPPAHL